MRNRRIRATVIAFNIIFVAVIIIFAPLSVYLFSLPNYFSLYEEHNVTEELERDELLKITGNLINFFRNTEPIQRFEPSGDVPAFTDDQISHLEDVRVLTNRLLIIFYSSLVLFILSSLLLISGRADFFRSMGIIFVGAASTVAAILLMLYLGSQNFWIFFEQFHLIFFPQGNYTFPADSLLITLFPIGFFYQFFLRLVTASGIILVIVLGLGILFLNIKRLK